MSDAPFDFDFKITPDWAKEIAPARNPYADFEGGDEREHHGFRDRRDDRRGRADARPPRGPRPGGERSHTGPPRRDGRGDVPRGRDVRRSGPASPREARQPRPEVTPADVNVEFLPASRAVPGIVEVIKTSHRAHALRDLAMMFIERPERHVVRISIREEGKLIYTAGGTAALDKSFLAEPAFLAARDTLYTRDTVELEEVKGTFANIARHRPSGTLLGPTNHHGYQSALRRLYDERFAGRISFEMFKRDIEVVSDPESVEAWKSQARFVTVWKTVGDNPEVFQTLADVEAHFRKHHFDSAVKASRSVDLDGVSAKNLPEPELAAAVRIAWYRQRTFPVQVIFHLRRQCISHGLHAFKWGGPAQFVAAYMPRPFTGDLSDLNDGSAAIYRAIASRPGCTRADLAAQILPADHASPDFAAQKSALASNFHWLLQAGYIVEFATGELEATPKDFAAMQTPPKTKSNRGKAPKHASPQPAPSDPADRPTQEGHA